MIFHCIQSHYETKFKFEPGLNFILADDNNVGKSTIFKTLSVISRMPDVSNNDLIELLRINENQGYARFTFSNITVTFWMFNDSGKVRAFFETIYEDNSNIRSVRCPNELIEALGIVRGSDNYPINFNDADSVQLIVDTSERSNQVMRMVLVDDRVEMVKQHNSMLFKEVAQDLKIISARSEENKKLLDSLSFNEYVDEFFNEFKELNVYSRTLDNINSVFEQIISSNQTDKFNFEQYDLNVLENLNQILIGTANVEFLYDNKKPQGIQELNTIFNLISKLELDSLKNKSSASFENSTKSINNLNKAVKTLSLLQSVVYSANIIRSTENMIANLDKRINKLLEELNKEARIVECPVKGKVFYGEECIPVGN